MATATIDAAETREYRAGPNSQIVVKRVVIDSAGDGTVTVPFPGIGIAEISLTVRNSSNVMFTAPFVSLPHPSGRYWTVGQSGAYTMASGDEIICVGTVRAPY